MPNANKMSDLRVDGKRAVMHSRMNRKSLDIVYPLTRRRSGNKDLADLLPTSRYMLHLRISNSESIERVNMQRKEELLHATMHKRLESLLFTPKY